jgi:hypothetical protein
VRGLPDADDRAQNEHAVNDRLEKTAIVFFRPDEQSVSRFPNWFEGLVCFHKVAPPYAMAVPRIETKS